MERILVFCGICFEMVQSSLPKKPQFLPSPLLSRGGLL